MTGTATDDFGVNAINVSIRDAQNRYLQDDGTVAATYNTIRTLARRDRRHEHHVVARRGLPYEGNWSAEAIAVDTAGQSDLRGGTRSWLVSATAIAPTVTMSSPAVVLPPTPTSPISLTAGSPVTFAGAASDDAELKNVEDLAAQHGDEREARHRRHVERRQRVRVVSHLTDQHRLGQLQLGLHHTVRPHPGELQLLGAGHRPTRPHDVVVEPGFAHDQREHPRRQPPERRRSRPPARSTASRCCTSTWPAMRPTTSACPGCG